METAREQFSDASLPWLFVYSGGEACPRYEADGETANKFHMYAIIACVF
jgi:hypothetical protein